MITKRRFIYLYLALGCFVGFATVFFVDGYTGIYDTLCITSGEREQKIELYEWLRKEGTSAGGARWGEKVSFCYEISNREFSTYSADTEVSLWHDEEEVRSLASRHMQIAPFGKAKLEWAVDTLELEPSGAPPATHPYKYLVIIKSGEIERKLKLYIYTPPS